MNRTGLVELNGVQRPRIVPGMLFPSGGIRAIALPLTYAIGMEEATGSEPGDAEARMVDLSTFKISQSGGTPVAAAFSFRGRGGDICFQTARAARELMFTTAHHEFKHDPVMMTTINAMHDLRHALPDLTKLLEKNASDKNVSPLQKDLTDLLIKTIMDTTDEHHAGGKILSLYERVTLAHGKAVAQKMLPRFTEAFEQNLAAYLATHPHRYDHDILFRSLTDNLHNAKFTDTFNSLFMLTYNNTTQQTEVYGAFRGDLDHESDYDSAFREIELGQTIPREDMQIPLYTKPEIRHGIMASTMIDGFIGQYIPPGTTHSFKDIGDFTFPAVASIMNEVVARTEAAMRDDIAPSKLKRGWFGQQVDDTQTIPAVLPRLMIFGVGYTSPKADRYPEMGVLPKTFEFMDGAQRAVTSSVLADISSKFNRLSRAATGRNVIFEINGEIDPSNPEHPSTDIRDGSIENLSKLTKFGAEVFARHAEGIAQELVISMQTLRDRGVPSWDGDKFDRAVRNVKKNLLDEKGLKALTDRLFMSQQDVADAISSQDHKSAPRTPPKFEAARQRIVRGLPQRVAALA